jgi:hypothetical protein
LEIRYRRIQVLPPIGKQKQYPELMLTVIHAQERGAPKGAREARLDIDHRLARAFSQRGRRKTQMVQHALEDRDLSQNPEVWLQSRRITTANSIAADQLITVFCILSWRIFWLAMMNRAVPDALPTLAFTALEIRLLDQLASVKGMQRPQSKSISAYLIRIARLGGYLARAGDAAPETRSYGEASPV